ncbi:MAG: response regulator transcription factor [Acidimicrobiales bacterium]
MGAVEQTIVVVEDDPSIADLLSTYLRNAGYRTLLAGDGTKALELFKREHPAMMILDLNLPGELDGLDICREVRRHSEIPLMMVTARDAELDRVIGLELGADDYVTKPFSPRELTARVKAILRRSGRSSMDATEIITVKEITIDQRRREVSVHDQVIPLTTREFDLLVFLASNRGSVLSRKQLLDGVWGPEWYGDDRTVDVHVRQLRKKLDAHFVLTTVWGVGYRLD